MSFKNKWIYIIIFFAFILLVKSFGLELGNIITSFNSFEGYIGFFAFVIIAILFRKMIGKSGIKRKKELNDYFMAEHKANFSRSRTIPAEVYYIPDISVLPNQDYPHEDKYRRIIAAQKRANKRAQQTMLRLDPPMKNIEIKECFGVANFENIISHEENYEQYARALANWANELIKMEEYDKAKKILLICLEMNPLFFLPYSLFCDLYGHNNDKDALINLRQKVKETPILYNNQLLATKINNYIDAKLDKLN